jgi:replicative DNA helicase
MKEMNSDTAKFLATEINSRPTMINLLTKSKNDTANSNQYTCIFCGSGTHEKGTGAMTDYGDHVYCHVCKKVGYNTDIIAAHLGCTVTGADFFKVIEYGCNELGIPYTESNEPVKQFSISATKKKNESMPTTEQPKKDYSKFYQYAQSRLPEFIRSRGGSWRGLSLEDLQAVHAGFNEREIEGAKIQSIILQHNDFSYFERSITDAPQKVKQHHGRPKVIYNPYEVLNSGRKIFIVEGEIDCITIHKFGYPCLALGGAAEINLMMKALATEFNGEVNKPKFIVMFDNNDGGKGQEAAAELIRKLSEGKYEAVNFILSPKLQYDANEFLQKDSAELAVRLAKIYDLAEKELSALADEIKLEEEKQKNEEFGTRLKFFFQHKFLEKVSRNKKYEKLRTGFFNLDERQEFEAGIYTIGAPPSLGKTSFLWQLMEQMARQSNEGKKMHCVFVSYEMPEEVLFSKSLARGVFELSQSRNEYFMEGEMLTATQIRKGNFGGKDNQWAEDVETVLKEYQKSEMDLRVLDLSQTPLEIDDLIKRLEKIASLVPSQDLLILGVDYLQRIPNKNQDTAKGAVDYAMLELKKLTQKTNSIIFLISSYNRNSYKVETGFEAFKESGAIEYGSDVMYALQLYCLDEKGKPSTSQADFDQAKMKQPRPMILKCLKNRYGNDYKIYFNYYSATETFVACEETGLNKL